MQKNFIFSILSVFTLFFLACSSDSGSSSNGNGQNEGAAGGDKFLASYEASDRCSTGRHVFTGSNEEELGTAFCKGINDEKLNAGCAHAHRKDIFRSVQCPGQFNTEKENESVGGNTSVSLTIMAKSYAFSETNCGTGLHYFTASKKEVLQKMVCQALADDELNRKCAKNKRDDMFSELECDPSFRNSKPELKTKPEVKDENEFKVGGEGSQFSCYHEKNVCNSSHQYCHITMTYEGLRSTDNCRELPKDCSDKDCIIEDATKHFDDVDNCKGSVRIKNENSQITVTCTGPPHRFEPGL